MVKRAGKLQRKNAASGIYVKALRKKYHVTKEGARASNIYIRSYTVRFAYFIEHIVKFLDLITEVAAVALF